MFRMLPKSFRFSSNLIVSLVFIVFHVYNLCGECRTENTIIFRMQLLPICTDNNCSVEISLFTYSTKMFTQNTCSLERCPTLKINIGMKLRIILIAHINLKMNTYIVKLHSLLPQSFKN